MSRPRARLALRAATGLAAPLALAPLALAPLAFATLAFATLATAAPTSDNHSNLWNFTAGIDGASARGDLLVDSVGNLYGTTSTGGAFNNGGVFEATTARPGAATLTPLYSFSGATDGAVPSAGLIMDSQGALYGTASLDGPGQFGTVFELTPPTPGGVWTETTLFGFPGGAQGATPVGSLVFDQAGALYGTTQWGGANNFGTIFKLTPPAGGTGAWTETILWNFTGGADGGNPVAGLVFDSTGALYGTAKTGGANNAGTVFQLSPGANNSWTQATLWAFTGGADCATPTGTLLQDGAGGFYGSAEYGGPINADCDQARYPYYGETNQASSYAANAAYITPGGNGCGVIFDLRPAANGATPWTQTVIWTFDAGLDGANPVAGLLAGPNGTLFTLSTEYGNTFWGTEILLTPPSSGTAWSATQLASFDGKGEGFYPHGTPVFGPLGLLYGTTTVGGKYWTHITNYGYGTIFYSTP